MNYMRCNRHQELLDKLDHSPDTGYSIAFIDIHIHNLKTILEHPLKPTYRPSKYKTNDHGTTWAMDHVQAPVLSVSSPLTKVALLFSKTTIIDS